MVAVDVLPESHPREPESVTRYVRVIDAAQFGLDDLAARSKCGRHAILATQPHLDQFLPACQAAKER
jgi:hypothetical protein